MGLRLTAIEPSGPVVNVSITLPNWPFMYWNCQFAAVWHDGTMSETAAIAVWAPEFRSPEWPPVSSMEPGLLLAGMRPYAGQIALYMLTVSGGSTTTSGEVPGSASIVSLPLHFEVLVYSVTVKVIVEVAISVAAVVPIVTVPSAAVVPLAIETQPFATTEIPVAPPTPVTANMWPPAPVLVLVTVTVKLALDPAATGFGVCAVTCTVPTFAEAGIAIVPARSNPRTITEDARRKVREPAKLRLIALRAFERPAPSAPPYLRRFTKNLPETDLSRDYPSR